MSAPKTSKRAEAKTLSVGAPIEFIESSGQWSTRWWPGRFEGPCGAGMPNWYRVRDENGGPHNVPATRVRRAGAGAVYAPSEWQASSPEHPHWDLYTTTTAGIAAAMHATRHGCTSEVIVRKAYDSSDKGEAFSVVKDEVSFGEG